eukprot:6202264-Pleurochrysis_carterae.AAC.3
MDLHSSKPPPLPARAQRTLVRFTPTQVADCASTRPELRSEGEIRLRGKRGSLNASGPPSRPRNCEHPPEGGGSSHKHFMRHGVHFMRHGVHGHSSRQVAAKVCCPEQKQTSSAQASSKVKIS